MADFSVSQGYECIQGGACECTCGVVLFVADRM